MAHYVASKGGVIGLTKALAMEYVAKGITVNHVPPGFIDTPLTRQTLGDVEAVARDDADEARRASRRTSRTPSPTSPPRRPAT